MGGYRIRLCQCDGVVAQLLFAIASGLDPHDSGDLLLSFAVLHAELLQSVLHGAHLLVISVEELFTFFILMFPY